MSVHQREKPLVTHMTGLHVRTLRQAAGFNGSEPAVGKQGNDGNDGAADENMSGLISNDFQVQVGPL